MLKDDPVLNIRCATLFVAHQILAVALQIVGLMFLVGFLNLARLNLSHWTFELFGVCIAPALLCLAVPHFIGKHRPDWLVGGRWAFIAPAYLFFLWFLDDSLQFGAWHTLILAMGGPPNTEGLEWIFFTLPTHSAVCYSIGVELARREFKRKQLAPAA